MMKSPQAKLRRRKARLPFVFCLLFAALPLAAQEKNPSFEALFPKLSTFSHAEVTELPAQGQSSENGNEGSLTVITLHPISSLTAEEKELLNELFETKQFSDVEMTMNARDGEDHVRSFVPKGDKGATPSTLYMLVISKEGYVAMKLTGSYVTYSLNANLKGTSEKESK